MRCCGSRPKNVSVPRRAVPGSAGHSSNLDTDVAAAAAAGQVSQGGGAAPMSQDDLKAAKTALEKGHTILVEGSKRDQVLQFLSIDVDSTLIGNCKFVEPSRLKQSMEISFDHLNDGDLIVVEEKTKNGFNKIITGEYDKPDPQVPDSGYLHFKNGQTVQKDRLKRVELVPREASQSVAGGNSETLVPPAGGCVAAGALDVLEQHGLKVGQIYKCMNHIHLVNVKIISTIDEYGNLTVQYDGDQHGYPVKLVALLDMIKQAREASMSSDEGGAQLNAGGGAAVHSVGVGLEIQPQPENVQDGRAFQVGQKVIYQSPGGRLPKYATVQNVVREGRDFFYDLIYKDGTLGEGKLQEYLSAQLAGGNSETLVPHAGGGAAAVAALDSPLPAGQTVRVPDLDVEGIVKRYDSATCNYRVNTDLFGEIEVSPNQMVAVLDDGAGAGMEVLVPHGEGVEAMEPVPAAPAAAVASSARDVFTEAVFNGALSMQKASDHASLNQLSDEGKENKYFIRCKVVILRGLKLLERWGVQGIDFNQFLAMSPAEILDKYIRRDLPNFDALTALVNDRIVEETQFYDKDQSPSYDRHYLESWALDLPVNQRIPVTSIKKSACPVLGPDRDLGTLDDTTPYGRPYFSGRIVELGSGDLAQYVVHGSPMQGNGPNKHDFYSGLNHYQPTCLIQAASVRHSGHGGIDQENFDFLKPGESEAGVSCVSLDEIPRDGLEQVGDALYLEGSSQNIEVRYLKLLDGTRVPQFVARQESLLLSDLKLIRQYLQNCNITYNGPDAKIMCGCKDGSDRSGRTAVYFHLMNLIETGTINLDEITLWDIKCIALQVQQQTHVGAAVSGVVSREMVAELTGDSFFYNQDLEVSDYLEEHPEFSAALKAVDNEHFTGLDDARRKEVLRSHQIFPMEGFRHILGS